MSLTQGRKIAPSFPGSVEKISQGSPAIIPKKNR